MSDNKKLTSQLLKSIISSKHGLDETWGSHLKINNENIYLYQPINDNHINKYLQIIIFKNSLTYENFIVPEGLHFK